MQCVTSSLRVPGHNPFGAPSAAPAASNPFSNPSTGYQGGYSQTPSGYGQTSNGYSQPTGGFSQASQGYSQPAQGYSQGQGQGSFSQSQGGQSQPQGGYSQGNTQSGFGGAQGQGNSQQQGFQGGFGNDSGFGGVGGGQQQAPMQTPPKIPTKKEAAALHDPFASLTGRSLTTLKICNHSIMLSGLSIIPDALIHHSFVVRSRHQPQPKCLLRLIACSLESSDVAFTLSMYQQRSLFNTS